MRSSLLSAISTLMFNQLRQLLTASIDELVAFFEQFAIEEQPTDQPPDDEVLHSEAVDHRPLFVVKMLVEGEGYKFSPSLPTLLKTVLGTIDHFVAMLNTIPRIEAEMGRASAGVAAAAIGYTADRAQCLSVELDEKTAAGLLKALSKAQAESFKAVYGDLADGIKSLDKWIQAGCGDTAYYCVEKGAVFGVTANGDEYTVDTLPDFSKHNNFMAEFFREHPEVYDKLKDKVTSSGVTLAQCMKTGVDNPGHPHIKTVGLVAGDEESYQTFYEIFEPVTSARHGGLAPDFVQPTDMDLSKLKNTDIDPYNKYVLTSRVRTGRSVRTFKLPPTISFGERRALEKLVTGALLDMGGDLKGDYFPLHGSKSYPAKPNGMSEEQEKQLRSTGNLFQEPDSTLLLASGMGRHWPDARGIFANDNKNLFVWLNEEDHLRIVSMQGDRKKVTAEGKQIKDVFARFIRACDEVQSVLKTNGADFMHSDHHGWILTCPSNLGTGLRAGCMVMLPLVSARDDFKKVLGSMRLQARGTGGVDSASSGGTWDISNADRIGKGEVQLCNILIENAAKLVKWENMMEGDDKAKAEEEITAMAGVTADYPPAGIASNIAKLDKWIQLGCGDKPYMCPEKNATFPSDKTPDALPDIKSHNNCMTDFFKANPGVYDELKDKVTSSGVNLAMCIKTGIDNPGHPMIKTVGLTAGDEESYSVFAKLFDPVISDRHNGYGVDGKQPTDMDISKISDIDIDPFNKYVLTTRVRTGRSVRGFKLPPVISFEERRKLEAVCVKALLNMKDDLKGDYFPLHGSRSYPPKPNGMSEEDEESLRSQGNLFQIGRAHV